MKVLDLFAGTRSISKAFESKGHDVFTIELDSYHTNIDWYVDILEVRAEDILERFGRPDVIWASPPCTTYSIAGIWRHRENCIAVSEEAKLGDKIVKHVLSLIDELKPKYYFIENPRGGLRKQDFIQHLPRHTVSYCQYGHKFMKPTDIWTNHPDPKFKPICKPGSPCHESAPSGSKGGVQGQANAKVRSVIPAELCAHIEVISNE